MLFKCVIFNKNDGRCSLINIAQVIIARFNVNIKKLKSVAHINSEAGVLGLLSKLCALGGGACFGFASLSNSSLLHTFIKQH